MWGIKKGNDFVTDKGFGRWSWTPVPAYPFHSRQDALVFAYKESIDRLASIVPEPRTWGSIVAEDVGKTVIMIMVFAGVTMGLAAGIWYAVQGYMAMFSR